MDLYICAIYYNTMSVMSKLKVLKSKKFWLNAIVILLILSGLFLLLTLYLRFYTKYKEHVTVPNIAKMDLFEAITTLDNAGLRYEIDTFKYDPSYKPYALISIYPKPGAEVKSGRRIFLRANPKTWRPVQVPNLINRSKYLAFTQLEIVGLRVGDTIAVPYKYPDIVLKMLYNNKEIKPGQNVPKFSKIDLVVGKSLNTNVPMINILGMTFSEAKKSLEQNFYELGMKNFFQTKDSTNAIVFYQSPLPGDVSDQGMMVDIWLTDKAETDENIIAEKSRLNSVYNKKIEIDSTGKLNIDIKLDKNAPKDAKPTGKDFNAVTNKSTPKPKSKPKQPKPIE